MSNNLHKWETVDSNTERMAVPTGWLYRTFWYASDNTLHVNVVFVPAVSRH